MKYIIFYKAIKYLYNCNHNTFDLGILKPSSESSYKICF